MRLNKINNSTAVDRAGAMWFRFVNPGPQREWPRCSECSKCMRVYWEAYPFMGYPVCENCIEFEEK